MAVLDVKKLLAEARDKTGLSDFGGDDFLPGLEHFVLGVNNAKNLKQDRAGQLQREMLRLLANRLWVTKDLSEHPEILEQQLMPPICICAFPRTGTTKTQRLLSALGGFQHLPYWQVHMPARIPGKSDGGRLDRIEETKKYCDWELSVSPEMAKAHLRTADEPEEETFLMDLAFLSASLPLIHGSPEYAEWVAKADISYAYDYLELQLKYLQWQFHGDNPKSWVLKSPGHMGNESQIARIFPQGRYMVCTHRDPIEIIPSICHLIGAAQTLYYDVDLAPEALGNLIMGWLSYALSQHMSWRDENPDIEVLDISFREITTNSMSTATKLCDFVGRPLSNENRRQIELWDSENPRHKHGRAEYSLENWGVTREQLDKVFEPYKNRFADYL